MTIHNTDKQRDIDKIIEFYNFLPFEKRKEFMELLDKINEMINAKKK